MQRQRVLKARKRGRTQRAEEDNADKKFPADRPVDTVKHRMTGTEHGQVEKMEKKP